jgi:hypothetical protein
VVGVDVPAVPAKLESGVDGCYHVIVGMDRLIPTIEDEPALDL